MAPIGLPRAPLGHYVRQASRSLSSAFAPPQSGPSIISRALEALTRLTTRAPHHTSPASILLSKRQTQVLAIPTIYQGLDAGPPPGTVVGIVLGSVGGFLLLLWLIYTCTNLGGDFTIFSGFSGWGRQTVVEEEVIRRRSRSRSASRSRSRASRTETVEVQSVHRSPSRRTRETIIVEERRTSRPPPPPEDDIVEVIEEHSPVRRPSRRESKRTSGFRTVDPAEFGGGDRPMRKVSRRQGG